MSKYKYKIKDIAKFDNRLIWLSFDEENLPQPNSLNIWPHPINKSIDDQNDKFYFFSIDNELVYLSFFCDFGPLNCAHLYRFCVLVHDLLRDPELSDRTLVLYSSSNPHSKANSALLMALYTLIVLRRSPSDAFHPIADIEFIPFRDAGRGRCDFHLSISDCLWGIYKAIQLGLLRMEKFDLEEYEYYEKVENGDWNWLTPNFIAFASPVDPSFIRLLQQKQRNGKTISSERDALSRKLPSSFVLLLDYFTTHSVKLIFRLNNPLYDAKEWTERGVDHQDLYFDDGTNPSDDIVKHFIHQCDQVVSRGGVVAVHCKAGLGRTGTLIGAYLIYKHGFTANEVIAFMRIMRPGSVVGPQQQYMYQKQFDWVRWGVIDAIRKNEEEVEVEKELIMKSSHNTTPIIRDDTSSSLNLGVPSTPAQGRPQQQLRVGVAETPAPVGQPRKTPATTRTVDRRVHASKPNQPNLDINGSYNNLSHSPIRRTKVQRKRSSSMHSGSVSVKIAKDLQQSMEKDRLNKQRNPLNNSSDNAHKLSSPAKIPIKVTNASPISVTRNNNNSMNLKPGPQRTTTEIIDGNNLSRNNTNTSNIIPAKRQHISPVSSISSANSMGRVSRAVAADSWIEQPQKRENERKVEKPGKLSPSPLLKHKSSQSSSLTSISSNSSNKSSVLTPLSPNSNHSNNSSFSNSLLSPNPSTNLNRSCALRNVRRRRSSLGDTEAGDRL